MPFDFAPSPCSAKAMQACLQAKECSLSAQGPVGVSPPGLQTALDFAIEASVSYQVDINASAACLTAALVVAFANAGIPFPTLPPEPEIPDLSECLEEVADNAAELQTTVPSTLNGIVTIDFNEDGVPTRIRSG